jgi:hypothetical protein
MSKFKINFISGSVVLILYWIIVIFNFKFTSHLNFSTGLWIFMVFFTFGTPVIIGRFVQEKLKKKFLPVDELENKANIHGLKFNKRLIFLVLPFLILLLLKFVLPHSKCLSGDCVYGYGTWSYLGNIYVGEFKNGEFNGQGTITYKNGSKYTGEFKNSDYDGWGTLTDANGKAISGIWSNDKFLHP